MSNPAKPILEINRAKSSAPTAEIEFLSAIKFANDTLRAAFAIYLGGGYAGPGFLEESLGITSVADLANVDIVGMPTGKHILWSEFGITYIHRLTDLGGNLPNNAPRYVLPNVLDGTRFWSLVHAADNALLAGTIKTFGGDLDLGGGAIQNFSAFGFNSETDRRKVLSRTVQWEEAIDGYIGTGSSLDTIETIDLFMPTVVQFRHAAEGLRQYRLRAGSEPTNSPLIIRPLDWAAATNEKVWEALA